MTTRRSLLLSTASLGAYLYLNTADAATRVFFPLGRIVWTPAQLFNPGDKGLFIDPSNSASVFQDSAGTTPAGSANPVGLIRDLSGNSNNFTSTNKPTRNTDGTRWWLEANGSGNVMSVAASTALFKFLHNGTPFELIAAVKMGSTSHPNNFISLIGNNAGGTTNVGFDLFGDDRISVPRTATLGTLISNSVNGQATQNVVLPDNSAPDNTDTLVDIYFDGTTLNIQLQRQLWSSSVNAHTPSAASASFNLALFGDGSNTTPVNTRFYPLFLINRVLSLSDRTLATGSVAQKAGITPPVYSVNANAQVQIVGKSPFNGYPGLCKLNTGSQLQLIVGYRTGANEEFTTGVLNSQISQDGGATWGTAVTFYNPGVTLDARGVSFLLLQNGTILANFAVGDVATESVFHSYVMIGTVSGTSVSWGSPILIDGDASRVQYASTGQGIQLANGTIVLPIWYVSVATGFQSAGVITSTDNGLTWSAPTTIAAGTGPEVYNETCLVLLTNGTIAAYVRHDASATTTGYSRVQSTDNGVTWTGLANVITVTSIWGQPSAVNRGTAVWLMARTTGGNLNYWQSSDAAGTTFGAGTQYTTANEQQAAILLPNGQIGAAVAIGTATTVGVYYQQFV